MISRCDYIFTVDVYNNVTELFDMSCWIWFLSLLFFFFFLIEVAVVLLTDTL